MSTESSKRSAEKASTGNGYTESDGKDMMPRMIHGKPNKIYVMHLKFSEPGGGEELPKSGYDLLWQPYRVTRHT
jgi:hypothetical protein